MCLCFLKKVVSLVKSQWTNQYGLMQTWSGTFYFHTMSLSHVPENSLFLVSPYLYMIEFRSWFDDPYPIHEIFLERISTRVKRCRFVVGGTKVFGSAGLMDKRCTLPLSPSLFNTYFELVPGPHQQQRQLEHTKWLLSPLLLFLPQWLLLAALP